MAEDKKNKKSNGQKDYVVVTEGEQRVLKIDYEDKAEVPSLENSPFCMSSTINILMKTGSVDRIEFKQREIFVYDKAAVDALYEIAELIKELSEEKNVLSNEYLGEVYCPVCFPDRYNLLRIIVFLELREDPIGAYVHLIDAIKKEKIKLRSGIGKCNHCGDTNEIFIKTLEMIFKKLESTALIQQVKENIKDYSPDDRSIYLKVFSSQIKPSFLYTKVMTSYPPDAEEIDSYSFDDNKVIILKSKRDTRHIYHLTPPEFTLNEDDYMLLSEAREIVARHKPTRSEFLDPLRARRVFFNVERDLLGDLFRNKGQDVNAELLSKLADILVRYTIGFGVVELILSDPKIQDVVINAPASSNAISVIHSDYGECITNVVATPRDVENWATKLRLLSGRPFDQANPILDTELILPKARIRVAAIQEPLSPSGIAYSFRRHRSSPWTLPLFVKNKMISPLAAAVLSFMLDGSRTFLIAGTRSAGKTSLLGSFLIEIMRKHRIITIEDTLELPVMELKNLNYDIQSLKVRSALSIEKAGLSASEGIRSSLRMGDSCLIVGEIRSEEARALYEAMRVGALANVVAGTIHGDSAYGVFDRVVNDLNVPKTSFKATDIIVIANTIKDASGLKSKRRVTQIVEVRKEWEEDPLLENGFVPLFEYNPKTDELEPTDYLLQGDSEVIKSIAGNVRDWFGDWNAVWNNILLRKKIKEELIAVSEELKRPELLEADFVLKANDAFHKISDEVKNSEQIYSEWKSWLNSALSF